ncbi:MAG: prepilin-type N-terminal cleavage/methylation domain-containing protein [Planctomycetota bacterium]|jgi:prepilin-type N-terminal cleavage/methylation domain-containing protein
MLRHRSRTTAGFTFVELLLALALAALLLTSLAAAFSASMMNYRQNEGIFKSVNNARQALSRMTTQIRTGLVDPNILADQSKCRLMCSDGSEIMYWYKSEDSKLYLRDFSTNDDYLLCDNVVAMTFKKDNSSPSGDVKSVQISMTVEIEGVRKVVSAAAVVRKIIHQPEP